MHLLKFQANALIYGLPGTGKITVDSSPKHLIVNLKEKESAPMFLGCEASYEDSKPGSLFDFLRNK